MEQKVNPENQKSESFIRIPMGFFADRRVTASDLAVYVALSLHMNRKSGECWPSLDRLSEESRLSVPTVIKAIRRLSEFGYVEKVPGKGRSSHYRILSPVSADGQNQAQARPEAEDSTAQNSLDQPSKNLNADIKNLEGSSQDSLEQTSKNLSSGLKNFKGSSKAILDEPDLKNQNKEPDKRSPLYPPVESGAEKKAEGHEKPPRKKPPRREADELRLKAEFEQFYAAYPSTPNNNRGQGLRNFMVLRRKGVSFDQLMTAARNYARCRCSKEPEYTKGVGNFLSERNGSYWLRYASEPEQEGTGYGSGPEFAVDRVPYPQWFLDDMKGGGGT